MKAHGGGETRMALEEAREGLQGSIFASHGRLLPPLPVGDTRLDFCRCPPKHGSMADSGSTASGDGLCSVTMS